MTELFYDAVNMSITAGILVLVVLLLRLLLKKAPKWMNVLLWGLVAVRLVCPFSIESAFSLLPKTEWVVQENSLTEEALIYGSTVPDTIPVDAYIDSPLGKDITITHFPTSTSEIEIHKSVSIPFLLSCIWLGGMVTMLIYMAVSYLRIFLCIRRAKQLRDNIYTSEAVSSPFVFGVIKPRICLPESMDAVNMSYVIAHEQAHIRRRDHLWKPIGFILLTVHWFNPLIWLSYILLCRDIELACDERVVRYMGDTERADYSEALLECSVKRSAKYRTMISACPLAFGEVGVKTRIKSVLSYKKPAFWIVVIAVIACVVTAVCFLTNPSDEKPDFTAVMEEAYAATPPITLSGYLDGTSSGDIYFTINDIRYTVSSGPTVSAPEYKLKADIDDGMEYVILRMSYGESERNATLHMMPSGGTERVYICDIIEFERLLTWQNSGMPVDLSSSDSDTAKHEKTLTLADVITLSAKGHDLTWGDFAEYSHTDIGSGLYIWLLPIDDIFSVKVGGSTRMEPMYVYLCAKNGEEEERIDIRDGGVEEFIQKNTLTDDSLLYGKPKDFYVDLAWDDAERLAVSEDITIDKAVYDLRHDSKGESIWIQFYGITEFGWDDRSVSIALKRDNGGAYTVLKDSSEILSNSEMIKSTNLNYISSCFDDIEAVIKANPSFYNYDTIRESDAYERMFTRGEELVLEFIFTEFLAGGHTDLHGDVMKQVMMELLSENEIIAYDAENGQDYFDHWLESARSVATQHDSEWLDTNAPAIALVISMT